MYVYLVNERDHTVYVPGRLTDTADAPAQGTKMRKHNNTYAYQLHRTLQGAGLALSAVRLN